jgi:SAM-dependent methyltransferase
MKPLTSDAADDSLPRALEAIANKLTPIGRDRQKIVRASGLIALRRQPGRLRGLTQHGVLMDEARKTNVVRGPDFIRAMFAGDVIDIGCGSDLVVPHARPFDLEHGDAQCILRYFQPKSFDTVHSSHCLEHMRDVGAALLEWWALVRPGGHLIVVVPEEDLYEQGRWPSLFNKDHKATFRLNRPSGWSPVSHDIGALVAALPGAATVDARVQDDGYDRGLMLRRMTRWNRFLYRAGKHRRGFFRRWIRRGVPLGRVDEALDRLEWRMGKPIDQTGPTTLAQIQVVVKKSGAPSIENKASSIL